MSHQRDPSDMKRIMDEILVEEFGWTREQRFGWRYGFTRGAAAFVAVAWGLAAAAVIVAWVLS